MSVKTHKISVLCPKCSDCDSQSAVIYLVKGVGRGTVLSLVRTDKIYCCAVIRTKYTQGEENGQKPADIRCSGKF